MTTSAASRAGTNTGVRKSTHATARTTARAEGLRTGAGAGARTGAGAEARPGRGTAARAKERTAGVTTAPPRDPLSASLTHPALNPALRRGWRDLRTVQFGVSGPRAAVLGPLDLATAGFLGLIDGTRNLPQLHTEGIRAGLDEEHVDRLLGALLAAGLLEDATGGGQNTARLRADTDRLERLRPDLASLSLLDPRPGGALETMAARSRAGVLVRGAGRVGATLAALLSAAGVGTVDVMDGGRVEPGDVSPGGLPHSSIGQRRADAARHLVRDAAPGHPRRGAATTGPDDAPSPSGTPPEQRPPLKDPTGDAYALVVLAPRDAVAVHAPDLAPAEPLMRSGIPHLYAGVVETSAVVGPLVLPGATGCAGCMEQERADRDPGLPRLLAQWRSGRTHRAEAVDLSLATATAALAASHALSFLDGHLPGSTGTRWEATLPRTEWRPRPVPSHARCGCGAAARDAGERDALSAAGR